MSDDAADRAERVTRLGDEIGYALGRGEFPANKINEFRWLWKRIPNQEKDGLSYTIQDIEALVKDLRNERSGKVRRVPIEHIAPGCEDE